MKLRLLLHFTVLHLFVKGCRVFPKRYSWEIFNNRLLFENNRLLFLLLFSGNFCGRGQGLDGGGQSHDGGIPQCPSPTRENPGMYCLITYSCLLKQKPMIQFP